MNEPNEHHHISEVVAPLVIVVASGIAAVWSSQYLVMLYRFVAGPKQGGAAMQFFLLVLMFYTLVYFFIIVYGVISGELVKAAQIDRHACLKHLSIAAVYSFVMLVAVLVKARNNPNDDGMIAFVIVWAVWFLLLVMPMTIYASRRCRAEDSISVE